MEIETKTYNFLELTLSLSIYDKTAAKKHWSLSLKSVFWTSNNLSQLAMFAPFRSKKFLGKRKDPITGNSFIESLF